MDPISGLVRDDNWLPLCFVITFRQSFPFSDNIIFSAFRQNFLHSDIDTAGIGRVLGTLSVMFRSQHTTDGDIMGRHYEKPRLLHYLPRWSRVLDAAQEAENGFRSSWICIMEQFIPKSIRLFISLCVRSIILIVTGCLETLASSFTKHTRNPRPSHRA